jgi:hypothetical protein
MKNGDFPLENGLPSGKRLQKTMENHHLQEVNQLSMGHFQ